MIFKIFKTLNTKLQPADPRHAKAAHPKGITNIIIIGVGHDSESPLVHYGGCRGRWFKSLPAQ